MNKNKIIGLTIWLITILVPFNIGFVMHVEAGITGLIYFLLTLVGMFVGGMFMSKGALKNGVA